MGSEMPPGRYEMSVSVHDNRRNEDALGSVTVIVHEVVKEAFVKQVRDKKENVYEVWIK